MKRLLVGMCLFSFVGFAQLNDPVTQIEYRGNVFQVDPLLTARKFDFMDESRLTDFMDLKLYQDAESIPYYSVHERNLFSRDTPLIIGIPFMSCGIGYRYYELIEEQPDFLLFREVGFRTEGNVPRVIVLNRLEV